MLRRISAVLTLALLFGLANAATVKAAESTVTTITVGEMCGGCVKAITAKLQPMSGVAKVQCDVKTKRVYILPVQGQVLSPRVLWEAMDEIGKTPTKLAGPSGTFTSKPKN